MHVTKVQTTSQPGAQSVSVDEEIFRKPAGMLCLKNVQQGAKVSNIES